MGGGDQRGVTGGGAQAIPVEDALGFLFRPPVTQEQTDAWFQPPAQPSELPTPPGGQDENYAGKALKYLANDVRQGILPDEALEEIKRDPTSMRSMLSYGEAAMAAGTLLSGGGSEKLPMMPDGGVPRPKLVVGNVQERLAKMPESLDTDTLHQAIAGVRTTLADIQESKARGVNTKPIEEGLNEISSDWQKIIDARDEPTPTVYHVTNAQFEQFDPSKSGSLGIHFGNAEQAANIQKMLGQNSRVIPAKLDIKKPIVLDQDLVFQDPENLALALRKRGVLSSEEVNGLKPEFEAVQKQRDRAAFDDDPQLMKAINNGHNTIQKLLQGKGYDGIIYPNAIEGKGNSYAVFDPKQIQTIQTEPNAVSVIPRR